MDFQRVKNGIASGDIILIDVRDQIEWDEGRIPGAKLLPLPEVQSALDLSDADFASKYNFPKPSKDAHVVTHCMRGGRGGRGAAAFVAAGYTKTEVYKGYVDWTVNGGAVEKGISK